PLPISNVLQPIPPRDRDAADARETRRRDRPRRPGRAEPPACAARRERPVRLTDESRIPGRQQDRFPRLALQPLPYRNVGTLDDPFSLLQHGQRGRDKRARGGLRPHTGGRCHPPPECPATPAPPPAGTQPP